MPRTLLLFALALFAAIQGPAAAESAATLQDYSAEKIRLVIRVDDVGFNHSSNMALQRLLDEGCVSAVSVMVVSDWLDEAVAILKDHPEVSVGVHTTLNSEWKLYRWGPVLPADEVPTLVDEWGKFFGTRADLMANGPDVDEVEKEIRAQIDLAIAKGLNISYIDHHMSAAVETPEMRKRFELIAADYGVVISRYFGERYEPVMYSVPPEEKADFFVSEIAKLEEPGLYLAVAHPGADVPEMQVLRDLNETGPANMSQHRQAETDALCDPRLRALLDERGIELVGYDTLGERFRAEMYRPDGTPIYGAPAKP